jgi:hypothetical protein
VSGGVGGGGGGWCGGWWWCGDVAVTWAGDLKWVLR